MLILASIFINSQLCFKLAITGNKSDLLYIPDVNFTLVRLVVFAVVLKLVLKMYLKTMVS